MITQTEYWSKSMLPHQLRRHRQRSSSPNIAAEPLRAFESSLIYWFVIVACRITVCCPDNDNGPPKLHGIENNSGISNLGNWISTKWQKTIIVFCSGDWIEQREMIWVSFISIIFAFQCNPKYIFCNGEGNFSSPITLFALSYTFTWIKIALWSIVDQCVELRFRPFRAISKYTPEWANKTEETEIS